MFPVLQRLADGTRHVLVQPTTTIGRADDAAIHVPIAAVSRHHAIIERVDTGHVLRDLDSRNGTFLNGARQGSAAAALRDGDELVIAGVESFRFIDHFATPAAPSIGRLTGVWIDPDTREVWVDAQPLQPPLSGRQQLLLELLAEQAGTIVSRDQVVDRVWAGAAADGVSAEAIDALVKRLRMRLRPLQIHGDYVQAVRGRGIVLDNGPD